MEKWVWFFFLSDSAVSVKFKILKSQPTQEPTTYLLNNMCWYNNTLMNLVETALHCTIHITRHTYTTYKKFEKMGVATRLRSNKNDLQDTPIKLKTFFNPVKIETLVLSPMSTLFWKGYSTKITGGLESKSELLTTYSLWKKYQLYLSIHIYY